MRIAYQGMAGAFSHEAALAFAADCEALAEATLADVVEAVLSGIAERGILPMANSAAGPVPGNRELLDDWRLSIIKTQPLLVRMHLLALPGVVIEEVRTVVSHPMALAQCASNLKGLGVATEEASNTAVAAAELVQRDRAVLASEAAARVYGLDIVRRNLHDQNDNFTIFSIFERRAGLERRVDR